MAKSRRNDPHEEDYQLDVVAINERISQVVRDTQTSIQAQDGRFNQLEEGLDARFAAITKMLADAISGKQREEGSNSAMHRDHHRNRSGSPDRHETRREGNDRNSGSQKVFLPRIDFPSFDGKNPVDWLEECKFYFEAYQIPEDYKSRMATMNFVGVAKEWFSCYRIEHPNPSWPELVERVFVRFKTRAAGNPIVQFRKTHQTGSVEEYIQEFERAKSRLLADIGIKHENFFVWNFIGGLREELQNTINLFKPQTLEAAMDIALELEVVMGISDKKVPFLKTQASVSYKPQNNPVLKNNRPLDNQNRRWNEETKSKFPTINPQTSMSLDQKRKLGLCYKCEEKWHQGHKCNKSVHVMEGEDELSEQQGDDQVELDPTMNEREMEEDMAEGYTIALNSINNFSSNQTLKFKGLLKDIPILALIDMGATHSFIHPNLVQALQLPTVPIQPLFVRVATGPRVVSDTECKGVVFT